MGFENLGPNVSQNPQAVLEPANGSGQYTAEDHSWDQLVIQQNKPAADWEINLLQQIYGNAGVRLFAQKLLPSGWLNGNFFERSTTIADYFFLSPDTVSSTTANTFQLASSNVNANGWILNFDLTAVGSNASLPSWGFPGNNYITLPAPPAGGARTDLVILEVWRALVSPAPDNTNKSQAGQILRYGNARSPDSAPNQNLADDLIDPVYGQETARRVQIQYRYRTLSLSGNWLQTAPDGLDINLSAPLTACANTVPTYPAPGVNGTVTTVPYAPVDDDPGLWVAGNGDQTSATALGTVDGFMYALPICAVFRRNSSPFDRSANMNGGALMSAGTSDRPDGLYSDQIVVGDVLDLRKGIAQDFPEILNKTFQRLLNGTLYTELEYNQSYGVNNTVGGTSYTFKDDITAAPFNAPGHIGSSDGVRINFSDRSVTESIVATSGVITGPATTVVFSMSSITPAFPSATTINVENLANQNAAFVGTGSVRMVNVSGPNSDIDLKNLSSPFFIKSLVYTSSFPGFPPDTVTITLNAAASHFTINAEIFLEYPAGEGASRNMGAPIAVWTPLAANLPAWIDPAQLSSTSDGTRSRLTNPGSPTVTTNLWWASPGHRELSVRLRSQSNSATLFADATTLAIWIPDKITGTVAINDGINAPYTTSAYVVNANYTKVTLTFSVPAGTSVSATWTALRPLPPVVAVPGDSYQFWYNTQAIQSVPVPLGEIHVLDLYTRSIPQNIHLITAGSGSPDDCVPLALASSQIPVGITPVFNFPESRLDAGSTISVSGLSTANGYVQLPVMIPYVPNQEEVQLCVQNGDDTLDGDLRNFWPRSGDGSSSVFYSPTIVGQPTTLAVRHKVAYPVLMELKQNFNGPGVGFGSIGRKGTIVLVVFSRWGDFDQNVNIGMSKFPSDSAAAVFRVPGNLINPRKVSAQ